VSSSNGHPRKTNRAQQRDAAARTPPPQAPPQGRPVAQGQFPPGQQGHLAEPPVPPSLEGVQAEFERMVAANQAKFAELAAQGTAPDPFFLVHARINHLIDAIAQATGPNGPRWAVMTRLGFEKYIAGELDKAGPATRRMQLAEGARYTPAMIAELARQTGTLHRPQ
jgi:hypothetical protein